MTTLGMAYGPHAVARVDGKVLFVRGAAPDEEAEVVIREDRRNFAYADLVTVLRPSAARREPPCRFLPRCGGCPWQHLKYASQLEAKRTIVTEQLRRIGGLDVPVSATLPSPLEFAYRRRLKLRVEKGDVGFYAGASHELVPIDHCLLAEPAVDAAIPWARDLAGATETRLRRIEVLAHGPGSAEVVVAGEAEGKWCPVDGDRCTTWLADHPLVRGLHLRGRGWQRAWGDTHIVVAPEPDLTLSVRAPGFTQVNPAANQLLVATVLRLLAPTAGQSILELYAGAGNLSLPLLRRGAALTAIEADRLATEDAQENSRPLSGSLRVIWQKAESAVGDLVKEARKFDSVVLDPPRSGAAAVLEPLIQLRPRRIVYVSCDPATLARDLRVLGEHYSISAVQPIDMFPHTYHVETVVRADILP